MENYELIKAINSLRPGASWSLDGETIIWLDETQTEPTKAQITKEIADSPKREADLLAAKATEKAALLAKLGITDDEAKLLLS